MDVETLSDADLTRRAATGSRQALSSLFDRHATTVTRYAWALASSRTDVAEIVQDTFVTMWKRSGEMALPHESLLPWLLVVCRGHALNPARIQAGAPSTPLADLLAPLEGDDARDKLRFVRAEIDALSPLDRQLCELCLVDGLPYSEAAARLGLRSHTTRVPRSRSRLRKAVTHDEH